MFLLLNQYYGAPVGILVIIIILKKINNNNNSNNNKIKNFVK